MQSAGGRPTTATTTTTNLVAQELGLSRDDGCHYPHPWPTI